MKAVMLAAGMARRLFGDENEELPKALLRFGGETLMERHVRILRDLGVDELTLVVGHQKEHLLTEVERVAPTGFVRVVENPRYRETPIISLACARETMTGGTSVLFMDADVLYHPELLERLIRSRHETCILLDRDFEPGEEPVKACVRDGVMVDFGKRVAEPHDTVGEWPGFMRMSPDIAVKIADRADHYVADGTTGFTYEEAMCDVLKAEAPGTFGFEDITGIPWIEIDFEDDLARAEAEILPRIAAFEPAARKDSDAA